MQTGSQQRVVDFDDLGTHVGQQLTVANGSFRESRFFDAAGV